VKFVIDGKAFDAAEMDRLTGLDALALMKQTGFGVQTLARRLGELGEQKDGAPLDPFDSEPHLRALFAFMWLSRRMAGERNLTFDEACDFPIVSLDVVVDEADEPEEAAGPQ
jgi:hypothetical protein